MNEPVQPVNHNKNERNAHDEGSRGEAAGIVAQRPAPPDRKVIGPAPPRRRLQPSEKQLKQQSSSQNHPQRQKSFNSGSHQTIMAGLYDLEETLGKGHFATVKAAKHVFTGERVRIHIFVSASLVLNLVAMAFWVYFYREFDVAGGGESDREDEAGRGEPEGAAEGGALHEARPAPQRRQTLRGHRHHHQNVPGPRAGTGRPIRSDSQAAG